MRYIWEKFKAHKENIISDHSEQIHGTNFIFNAACNLF